MLRLYQCEFFPGKFIGLVVGNCIHCAVLNQINFPAG